jgi:hypothetical protein
VNEHHHRTSSDFGPAPGEATTYRVQLGHTTTTVRGRTVAEAIREARRALCKDMPRMWDVIHKLDDSQFVVEPIQ